MNPSTSLTTKLLLFLCIGYLASGIPYDYYVFSSSWLGTECRFTSCWANQTEHASKNFFGIHGLWPDYWQGYPAYCDISPFDRELIYPDLLAEMNQYWISAYGTNDKFWDHEWQKHGTCWNDPETEENGARKMNDYFGTIVEMALIFDIYGYLAENGIIPSESAYQLSDISAVFTNVYGEKTYLLECKVDSDGNQYFGAANLCMNLDYELIECPQGAVNSFTDYCQEGSVFYPEFI